MSRKAKTSYNLEWKEYKTDGERCLLLDLEIALRLVQFFLQCRGYFNVTLLTFGSTSGMLRYCSGYCCATMLQADSMKS